VFLDDWQKDRNSALGWEEWSRTWTGAHQVRNVRLYGDKLYISTNPQSNGIDGRIIVGELVWERVK
jgi:hypothetical protein